MSFRIKKSHPFVQMNTIDNATIANMSSNKKKKLKKKVYNTMPAGAVYSPKGLVITQNPRAQEDYL